MSKVIAVFGSARRHGNTGKFIDWIAQELDINVVDLSTKNISSYDYDHKNIEDDFIPLVRQLLKYKKIIFATPVYWYGPSVPMKTFIDRTSDFLDVPSLKDIGRELRQKTAYVVCTSISDDADSSFINAFKDTFEYLGITYGGYVHANCHDGYQQNHYRSDVEDFIRLINDEL